MVIPAVLTTTATCFLDNITIMSKKESIISNQNNHQSNNRIYLEYYERKRIAMVMEENNNSKIIVIPSLASKGASDEWLKLGGNSAYFYKYLIAPRLHKKPPTIHPDTDLNYRFKSGIIAIHWREAFIKNMATLNLKPEPESESGLLIFNLNRTFTPNEIKKLHSRENEAKDKTNQLLKPKATIPELYQLLLILSQALPNKIRKMDEFYRWSFGHKLTDILTDLFEQYIKLAEGSIDRSTAKHNFTELLDRLNAILIILNENRALDYSTSERLGTLLVDIRNCVSRNLKGNPSNSHQQPTS